MAKIFNLRIHRIDLLAQFCFPMLIDAPCSIVNSILQFLFLFFIRFISLFWVWHMSTNHYQTHPLNQLQYSFFFLHSFYFIYINESLSAQHDIGRMLGLTVKFVSMNKIKKIKKKYLKICDANDFIWLDSVKMIWQLNNNDYGNGDNAKRINKVSSKNTY